MGQSIRNNWTSTVLLGMLVLVVLSIFSFHFVASSCDVDAHQVKERIKEDGEDITAISIKFSVRNDADLNGWKFKMHFTNDYNIFNFDCPPARTDPSFADGEGYYIASSNDDVKAGQTFEIECSFELGLETGHQPSLKSTKLEGEECSLAYNGSSRSLFSDSFSMYICLMVIVLYNNPFKSIVKLD